jgi:hypothetical protein
MAKRFDGLIADANLDLDRILKELSDHQQHTPTGLYTADLVWEEQCVSVQRQPLDDGLRNLRIHAAGSGGDDGWAHKIVTAKKSAAWLFQFTPTESGIYRMRLPLWAVGHYYVIADDGPCNDEYASISAIADVDFMSQYGSEEWVTFARAAPVSIAADHMTNGSKLEQIVLIQNIDVFHLPLTKDVPISVVVTVRTHAKASGGGSIAEVNFAHSRGALWRMEMVVCWRRHV